DMAICVTLRVNANAIAGGHRPVRQDPEKCVSSLTFFCSRAPWHGTQRVQVVKPKQCGSQCSRTLFIWHSGRPPRPCAEMRFFPYSPHQIHYNKPTASTGPKRPIEGHYPHMKKRGCFSRLFQIACAFVLLVLLLAFGLWFYPLWGMPLN